MNLNIIYKLMEAQFTFAKTMPNNPHEYTLKKNWDNPADFVKAVGLIREYGYKKKYGGSTYTCFDINGYYYWTMFASAVETTLINRARLKFDSPYDAIAEKYDGLFEDAASREEDLRVMGILNIEDGDSVLDIGCGTGLILDYTKPHINFRYVGFDPSMGMLQRLIDKHSGDKDVTIINGTIDDFYSRRKFSKVVSTFGSLNYVCPRKIDKVLDFIAPGGEGIFMLYKQGYHPVTYEKMDMELYHHYFEEYTFPEGSEVVAFNENYNVVVVRK